MGNLKLILFPQGELVPSVAHLCSPLGSVLGSAKAVHTMGTAYFNSGLETCFKVFCWVDFSVLSCLFWGVVWLFLAF